MLLKIVQVLGIVGLIVAVVCRYVLRPRIAAYLNSTSPVMKRIGPGISTYSAQNWEIDVLDPWQVELHKQCVTFYRPDGVGALQISAYRKEVDADDEGLFASTGFNAGQHPDSVKQKWGEFEGFEESIYHEGSHWRKWLLTNDSRVLFVTYNCNQSSMGIDDEQVNSMLRTLRAI